jgi:hypothetical protein
VAILLPPVAPAIATRYNPAAMAFLRRHNRALLCVAAGVLLSALTYQSPF